MRVVSLLPSATDTVAALGLAHLLVGRSHECDAPGTAALPAVTGSRVGERIPIEEIGAVHSASVAALRELQLLGPDLAVPLLEFGLSVYHLHLDALIDLRPDVVLTCLQDAHGAILEGQLLDAALLSALGYSPRVVHCSGSSLEGAWADMQAIADALGQGEGGRRLVDSQHARMDAAADACRGRGRLRVAVFQWPHPLMAAGGWVTEMVQRAGSIDVFGSADSAAAPTVATERLAAAAPQVVIWALCGLDMRKSERAARAAAARLGEVWRALPAVRAGHVAVVDGERVFSRPGLLLTESFEALVEILHPEVQRCHEGRLWQAMEAGDVTGGGAAGVAASSGSVSTSGQALVNGTAPAIA